MSKELLEAANRLLDQGMGAIDRPPWVAKAVMHMAVHIKNTVHADDDEPVTEEWLVSEFDADKGAGEYINRWCIHDDSFPIFVERSWKEPNVWIAHIDDEYFPIDIHARVQVRALVRMCHKL
jgi:hypothetical protein